MRLGQLPLTGLADALIFCGKHYGSDEGRDLASGWMEEISHAAYAASIELAREKGAFPLFSADKFLDRPFPSSLPRALQEAIAARSPSRDQMGAERTAPPPYPPPQAGEGRDAGDPIQYALAKLHLPEAQTLARGRRVVVAVIDTEIDQSHPELAGTMRVSSVRRPTFASSAYARLAAARDRLSRSSRGSTGLSTTRRGSSI